MKPPELYAKNVIDMLERESTAFIAFQSSDTKEINNL